MNVTTSRNSKKNKNHSEESVPLFPKKIQIAIIIAFIAVIAGIVGTNIIIGTMIFSPSSSQSSKKN